MKAMYVIIGLCWCAFSCVVANNENYTYKNYFTVDGINYVQIMRKDDIASIPRWNPEKDPLVLPFSKAIRIAKAELSQVFTNTENWSVERITMNRASASETNLWFLTVHFDNGESDVTSVRRLNVWVTLDGRMPKIVLNSDSDECFQQLHAMTAEKDEFANLTDQEKEWVRYFREQPEFIKWCFSSNNLERTSSSIGPIRRD